LSKVDTKNAASESSVSADAKSTFSFGELIRSPAMGALIGMLIVFIIFAMFGYHRNFLSFAGFANWMNFASTVGIIAIPVAFLMISGELDISTGAVMPASAMMLGISVNHYDFPMWLGMVSTVAMAASVGLINGLLVTRTQVPSFIVTLATLFAVGGLTLALSDLLINNTNVSLNSPDWAKAVFGTRYFGFRTTVFWWLGLIVVFWFFLHKSPWGNWVFAMGGDPDSAHNAGIPVSKMKIGLFILCAVCTSLAGMLQVIQFNSAQSATFFNMIFFTIIACVVGGVLRNGGFGSVVGVVFGTMTLGIVQQGINYTEIDRNYSLLIIGVMLLIAVLMNGTFQRLATSWSTGKKED
jgi:simple sugar transport system permease protein